MGQSFVCGFCGDSTIASQRHDTETETIYGHHLKTSTILQCSNDECSRYNVFDEDKNQFPAPPIRKQIKNLPDDIQRTWNEACNCFSVNAFTASSMLLRKILMHVAENTCPYEVASLFKSKKEKSNKENFKPQINFEDYVNILEKSGNIAKPLQGLFHIVRNEANIVNHELEFMDKDMAQKHIDAVAMLLEVLYYHYDDTVEEE